VPVPEIDLRRIKKWCTQETSPLHADQLRVTEVCHQLDHLGRGLVRAALGPPRTRLERALALLAITRNELGDPSLRDPVVAGDRGLGSSLKNNGGDDKAGFRHPMSVAESFLCPERCVSYVLNEHTSGRTK